MDDIIVAIRGAIEKSGMVQKVVAERAGMKPALLSASLNGHRRLMATEFIGLCRVLNLSPDDVMAVHKKAI